MSIKKSLAKYPCVGAVRKQRPNKQRPCKFCSNRADFIIDIQWWWFRGDDDVVPVCATHKPTTKEDILKLYPEKVRDDF